MESATVLTVKTVADSQSATKVSIETTVANHTSLYSAAIAAQQACLTSSLNTTDNTGDFIDRNEVINLVNTAS